jgi:hypothetical protein
MLMTSDLALLTNLAITVDRRVRGRRAAMGQQKLGAAEISWPHQIR